MTKHPAKRLYAGCYTYRGYKIEEVGRYAGDYTRWNVTGPNETDAHDTMNTLAEAKEAIDYWFATRHNS